MTPWETIAKAATDRRSGAAGLTMRVIPALGALASEREVLRAARKLLRAQPAMAPLWHACAAALEDGALAALAERIDSEIDGVARAAAGWALPRKRSALLTHSASETVVRTLLRAGAKRVGSVACTASLPGGEGRALAARLRREGLDARVVADATVVRETAGAAIVLVGGDAITEDAVINKVGTYAVALAARECGVPCYALAGTTKLLPAAAWNPDRAPLFEATPLALFDAVITERGPLRPAAAKRAAGKVRIPASILTVAR